MTVLADPILAPLVLYMRPDLEMDDEQFFRFCQRNRDWRIERTAQGDLLIMPPAGGETGSRNFEIAVQFGIWVKQDGTGVGFDSSTGFTLPSSVVRSPDAAWVLRSRLVALTAEQKQRFLPLCPDFVIELRSPSDSLLAAQNKMQEYLDNGARLGWLVDPAERRVYVYRPSTPTEVLDDPAAVNGDPVLPGFVLDLRDVWTPPF